jgi:substrate import-associated zinc metallohydrolase lipoprotein
MTSDTYMNTINRNRRAIVAVLMLIMVTACQEDDKLVMPAFPQETAEPNAIDQWLYTNYTEPFNIAVDYRWKPFEVPVNKDLVPVKEEKVVPVMTVVKEIWIDPYVQLAGSPFMKQYAPKQFVLVGSAQYNNDGTIVLGEAESGRKVTLYVINNFSKQNVPAVKQMLHTIHHEFAHILHQTKVYPREYKQITPSGYTASWYNTDQQSALNLGFITPYARSSADEDLVEMIATMLVEGKDGYDARVALASAQGQTLLRKKEAMVVSYFKTAWGIDFYHLQELTEQAVENATN